MSTFVTDYPQFCWEISTPTRFQNLHKQILLHFFFAPSLETRPKGITYLTADVPLFMTQSFQLMRNTVNLFNKAVLECYNIIRQVETVQ